MSVLGRLVLLVVGLILAVPAGALALAVGAAFEPAAHQLVGGLGLAGIEAIMDEALREGAPELLLAEIAIGIWFAGTLVLVLPPALVAAAGEAIGTRALAFYGGLTGALTASVPWLMRGGLAERPLVAAEGRLTALLFVAGAVAGLTYWLVSGRSAGRSTSAALASH